MRGSSGLKRIAMFNRCIRLAEIDLHPGTDAPGSRQIRIESERSVDKGGAFVKVTDNVCENVSSDRECNRVIAIRLHRSPSEAGGFHHLFFAIDHPAVHLTKHITLCRPGVGRGKLRVEIDCPPE